MYVNTYCLAHHLAAGLSDLGKSCEEIDRHFVLEDSWRGLPQFTYRTDIEIFVGVDQTITNLRDRGHKKLHEVQFTKYCQRKAFIRTCADNEESTRFDIKPPLLVTDIVPSAEIVREKWVSSPPLWLSNYDACAQNNLEIIQSTDRSIGSLLQTRKKVYIFGAPMTQIMLAQSGIGCKYEEKDADAPAIPTYYVLRCNAEVPKEDVSALKSSMAQYYNEIYSSATEIKSSGFALPRNYARLALSSGQPNPFPEIYPAEKVNLCAASDIGQTLTDRYQDMLMRHHQNCGP
jgi:hypothetical protein